MLVLSLLGWLFAGSDGMKWVLIIGAISLVLSPRLSPHIILKWYGARPLSQTQTPVPYSAIGELSRRAKLPAAPKLYYVPTSMLNILTAGTFAHPGIWRRSWRSIAYRRPAGSCVCTGKNGAIQRRHIDKNIFTRPPRAASIDFKDPSPNRRAPLHILLL